MSLYNISLDYADLFDRYEIISAYEFTRNTEGKAVDDDGNVIADPEAAKQEMLEAWFDTMTGIEDEWGLKAENVACYIKNLKADIEALDNEEKALKSRRFTKVRQAERLKQYLMNCMDGIGVKKYDTPRANISIRNNPESVEISNEIAFINWAQANGHEDMLKYSMPDVSKRAVLKSIKDGVNIPDARITRSRSVVIK